MKLLLGTLLLIGVGVVLTLVGLAVWMLVEYLMNGSWIG